MSVLLPPLVEVSGYSSKVLHDGNGLDLSVGRVEDSCAVAMKLTHGTERLRVACVGCITS